MRFTDDWMIFSLLTLILFIIVICFIFFSIFNYKKNTAKIFTILFLIIFFGIYYINCRYINQQKIAYYCVDEQCISIIHSYKNLSINSPMYAKIYKGKLLFRFQTKMENYIEILMEDDILISKKLRENKFTIYGSMIIMHGHVDNIEAKESFGYIYRSDAMYIASKNLKFKNLY